MLIKQYISPDDNEVLPTDSISYALEKMNDLHLKQLAVVENNTLIGLIDEDILLDEFETEQPLLNLKQQTKQIYTFDYQHIYDALQLVAHHDLYLVPVLDKEHYYLGSLTKQDILSAINTILGDEDSAIIVLELGIRDNALSHIARIIESENTHIYSTAIHQIPDSSKLELTLKVNKTNFSAVIASLWRNNYIVKATFRDTKDHTDTQSRYLQLMNYLDL